jgi:hypothetical protein
MGHALELSPIDSLQDPSISPHNALTTRGVLRALPCTLACSFYIVIGVRSSGICKVGPELVGAWSFDGPPLKAFPDIQANFPFRVNCQYPFRTLLWSPLVNASTGRLHDYNDASLEKSC